MYMKFNKSIGILWLPLICFWTFIITINLSTGLKTLEELIPSVIYFITSLLLVLQIQIEIGNKNEDSIVQIAMVKSQLTCLSLASISILANALFNFNQFLTLCFIIIPTIVNSVLSELLNYANSQLTTGFKARSNERQFWIESKKAWSEYILKAKQQYIDNEDIIRELNRVEDILNFSSYFRKPEAEESLIEIKQESDLAFILNRLTRIK